MIISTVCNVLSLTNIHAVTDCCTRMCCGKRRPYQIKIFDNSTREVIHLHRLLRCDSCWCPCCLQVNRLRVVSSHAKYKGSQCMYYVELRDFILKGQFSIKNSRMVIIHYCLFLVENLCNLHLVSIDY